MTLLELLLIVGCLRDASFFECGHAINFDLLQVAPEYLVLVVHDGHDSLVVGDFIFEKFQLITKLLPTMMHDNIRLSGTATIHWIDWPPWCLLFGTQIWISWYPPSSNRIGAVSSANRKVVSFVCCSRWTSLGRPRWPPSRLVRAQPPRWSYRRHSDHPSERWQFDPWSYAGHLACRHQWNWLAPCWCLVCNRQSDSEAPRNWWLDLVYCAYVI